MARGKNHVVEGTHPVKAVKQLNTLSDEDKIVAYLNSDNEELELSPKLEHLLHRWEFAYDIYRSKRSINSTIRVLIKREWDGETISRRTARRDLQMAMKVFRDGSEHDRKVNIDFLLEDIAKDIRLARANEAYSSIPALRKLQLEIINIHMGDNMAEMYKEFNLPDLHFGNFPEKLKTKLPPAEELAARMEAVQKKKVTDKLEAEDITFDDGQ